MKPEQQRIVIAEACGWRPVRQQKGNWYNPSGQAGFISPPDYLTDLNAMHEAERSIPQPSDFYRNNLIEVVGDEQKIHLATAPQRAEAFLRTLNLWTPTS